MAPTLHEIDSAIAEAEGVRSRHDGVHAIHSYVSVLSLCRCFAESGEWPETADRSFGSTMTKIRCIDRTGFAPHQDWETDCVPQKPSRQKLAGL
jgi:hypothetical protein